MKNKGLGKGLSTLLKEGVLPVSQEDAVQIIDIDKIEVGDYQPRKNFDYDKIRELADSIKHTGLLQPIIVSKSQDEKYKIIAGERRWRACKLNDFTDIPVIIKNITSKETLEIALVENIQREELSAIEEAEGLERLVSEFNYTAEQLSQMLGKSRSHIANLLRLNQLPFSIKDMINKKQLTMGHARCLIGHESAEVIADYIIKNDLNVRQTEDIVKNWSKREYTKEPTSERTKRWLQNHNNQGDDLQLLARSLSEKFGVKITIEDYPIGGKLTFHYKDMEQLDLILTKLN